MGEHTKTTAAESLLLGRRREKLTHAQLAPLLGCGHETLSLIENGRRSPSLRTAAAIQCRYGIPMIAWVPLCEHCRNPMGIYESGCPGRDDPGGPCEEGAFDV